MNPSTREVVVYLTALLIFVLSIIHPSKAVRIYPYKMDPREHPDYKRYAVPHPSLDVFEPLPQFATLRSLAAPNHHLVNYTQLLDLHCLNPNTTLGHVVWPGDPAFMFADNYKDFVDFVKDKGLYISSVHGFSPVVAGYHPPKDVLDYLDEKLGSKWFGMAMGEQDGHYSNGFARQQLPLNSRPMDQYLNFREYFHGMETILGPKLTTLLSSTYVHQQLKTGLYTMAGGETSQHGPNAQLRYAFIRGAGKQYGVIWFGNVSVYNRFGWKTYYMTPETSNKKQKKTRYKDDELQQDNRVENEEKHYLSQNRLAGNFKCANNLSFPGYSRDEKGEPSGPTCGTSLNLMKRLMYAQMLYNSGYVSFEGGWFYKDEKEELSPIGLIQHHAFLWTQGTPLLAQGVHVPTIAFYLDFLSGWTAPRYLTHIFRTWTNLPYTAGDYLTDGLFREAYPCYQDASYFHDETGASSPTPFGDAVDVLLSDAPSWILKRYDTVIVAGEISGGLEVETNLLDYVESGGKLVLTAGNLIKFQNGAFNVTTNMICNPVRGDSEVFFVHENANFIEQYNMTVCDLNIDLPPSDFTTVARLSNDTPLIVNIPFKNANGGSVTVLATPFAVSSDQVSQPVSEVDVSLPSPYPLLDHARKMFNYILSNASIVYGEGNLTLVQTLLNASTNEFLVLVSNPQLMQQPLKWGSHGRELELIEEISLDQSEKEAVGYVPDGYEDVDLGKSSNTTIAGGDTRLFRVRIQPTKDEEDESLSIEYIKKVIPKPRPIGVGLHLRHVEHSVRYEILKRPTFSQHYDSVVVDFSYVDSKDENFLAEEGKWLSQQSVRVYVDASPSINLFPSLRFVTDDPASYNYTIESLKRTMLKMATLGSHDLIVSLHTFPGDEAKNQSSSDFNKTLHTLNDIGARSNITVHLLDTPKNAYGSLMPLSRWLEENGLSSIKIVLNLARLVNEGISSKYDTVIKSQSSLLYVAAPGWDSYGQSYGDNVPIANVNVSTREAVSRMLLHVCTLRQCPYSSEKDGTAPAKLRQQQLQDAYEDSASTSLDKKIDSLLDKKKDSSLDKKYLTNIITPTSRQGGEREIRGAASFLPLIMDSVYSGLDEEFADVHFVEFLLLKT